MKIFVNQDIKKFFLALSAVLTVFTVLAEVCVYLMCSKVSLLLLVLSIFIMEAYRLFLSDILKNKIS